MILLENITTNRKHQCVWMQHDAATRSRNERIIHTGIIHKQHNKYTHIPDTHCNRAFMYIYTYAHMLYVCWPEHILIFETLRQTISDHTHFSHFRFFEFARALAHERCKRCRPTDRSVFFWCTRMPMSWDHMRIISQIGPRSSISNELRCATWARTFALNDYRLQEQSSSDDSCHARTGLWYAAMRTGCMRLCGWNQWIDLKRCDGISGNLIIP